MPPSEPPPPLFDDVVDPPPPPPPQVDLKMDLLGPLWAGIVHKMHAFSGHYGLDMSAVPAPPALVALMQEEGCPLCLHTSTTSTSPCVILTCRDRGCQHVCHIECMAAPFWVYNLMASHPPISLCARPTLAYVEPLPDLATAAPMGGCYFELSFHHFLSDGRVLYLQAHNARTIHDADTSTSCLRVTSPERARALGGGSNVFVATTGGAGGMQTPSTGPSYLTLQRGRISCVCYLYSTGMRWRHSAFFDVTSLTEWDEEEEEEGDAASEVGRSASPRDGADGAFTPAPTPPSTTTAGGDKRRRGSTHSAGATSHRRNSLSSVGSVGSAPGSARRKSLLLRRRRRRSSNGIMAMKRVGSLDLLNEAGAKVTGPQSGKTPRPPAKGRDAPAAAGKVAKLRRTSFNSVESEGGVPLLVFVDPVSNNRLSLQLQLVPGERSGPADARVDAPPKYCIINVDYHFNNVLPAPLASPAIPLRAFCLLACWRLYVCVCAVCCVLRAVLDLPHLLTPLRLLSARPDRHTSHHGARLLPGHAPGCAAAGWCHGVRHAGGALRPAIADRRVARGDGT